MRSRLIVLFATAAVLVSACGSGDDDWSLPHAKPTAVGSLGAGFWDPKHPPPPEGTLRPQTGSWAAVHPSKGYRVVLLTTDEDAPTRTLSNAVDRWADDEDVSLKTVAADDSGKLVDAIVEAMALKPDLIVATGNRLSDPLALVTASHLKQQFLVLGAEVAEPTVNVTSANWVGAAFRGEGLDMSSFYDPKTFTPERGDQAIRAGVAAVLNNLTGIVIQLP